MEIKDRVKELKRMTKVDLLENAGNWRIHPQAQRDAFRKLAQDVGIVGALIAYESERYGGLTLIDGHMRMDEAPSSAWPVLVLDVNDEEADRLLAELDPMVGMARANVEALEKLRALRIADGDGDGIDEQLAEMKMVAEIMGEVDDILEKVAADGDAGGGPSFSELVRRKTTVRVAFAADGPELDSFERALMATNAINRAEAVRIVSDFYLEHHVEKKARPER